MKIFIPSLIVTSLLLVGCGGGSDSSPAQQDTTTDNNNSCALESALALKSSIVEVSQNTVTLSNKIIKDMNETLDNINKMNEAIYSTLEVASQTVKKMAEPLSITDNGKKLFTIDPSKNPAITINQVLTKKYILVSSPSRFFPDAQSVKTLFNDASTLTNALNKAFNGVDSSKSLYLTILELESDNKFTNLTNGILIKGK